MKSKRTNLYLLGAFSFLVLALITIMVASGFILNPLRTVRAITRKKSYPVKPNSLKMYSDPEPPIMFNWPVKYPNKNVYILCYGGLGNTIVALALAIDTCMKYGIKQPTLLYEEGADFDFHKVDIPKYEFSDYPTTLQEMFPWVNSIIARSILSGWLCLSGAKPWKGTKDQKFPTETVNVFLMPDNSSLAPISDEAFIMTKKLFSRSIFNYINRNYKMVNAMAVHLRLGQPTDSHIPASPSIEDINEHYSRCRADNVYLFTDNIRKAEEIMKSANFSYSLVHDTNYIDFLLISMCESAVISESTFSISACRLGNIKNVSIAINGNRNRSVLITSSELFQPEWRVIVK